MNLMTIDDLVSLVKDYNPDEVDRVIKAYNMAEHYHKGQKRESGEPYVNHPLNVAYILALMHADGDTLCAGLLHDTLEDTSLTKEAIESEFGKTVALLVDGVTKISRINFISKEEMNYANMRKIITSLRTDIRIIIIKLADRLHNMRTLSYKTPEKQRENARETAEIFVPIASAIGAYKIKRELEDLAFMYLYPDMFYVTKLKKENIERENELLLKSVLNRISEKLNDKRIPNEIKIRTKNVYGVYKYISKGKDILSLHDILALKIMVDSIDRDEEASIDNCYRTLGYCHSLYKPVNELFKDYIANPKTTMYKGLHTTVFADENKLVQLRIRSNAMDVIGSYGLTANWYTSMGNAKNIMQEDLISFQFFEGLSLMDDTITDNKDFVTLAIEELFSEKVYICTGFGEVIEMPVGSTIIDFAYRMNPETATRMIRATVNGEEKPFDYVLKNKDRVNVEVSDLALGPDVRWENFAQTSYARKLIHNYINKTTD